MKKLIYTTALLLALLACNSTNNKTAILNVLEMQETAWNKGNIAQFMEGYWKSDSLMFVGKNGIQYGWETTLQNYLKSYPNQAAMGQLRFEIIQLEIDNNTAFMLGKWRLTRKNDSPNGHFSLHWKKIAGQWLIVIDHSS